MIRNKRAKIIAVGSLLAAVLFAAGVPQRIYSGYQADQLRRTEIQDSLNLRAQDSLVLVKIREANPKSDFVKTWSDTLPIERWEYAGVDSGRVRNLYMCSPNAPVTIPDETVQLDGITSFGVYGKLIAPKNRPSLFPAGFEKLTNINGVTLIYCGLTKIPDEILKYPKLSSLDMNNNQIRELPKALFDLPEMVSLNFMGNQIDSVPESIGNLKKLEHLYLSRNRLRSLPNSLGNCTNLNFLTADTNEISTVPPSIFSLKRVKMISLISNRITSVTSEISESDSLWRLHLSDNLITEIPDELCRCASLDDLNLDGNQIKTVPAALFGMKKLTCLSVGNNQIRSFPPELSRSKLNYLIADHNELTELPDLSELELFHLNVSHNKLKEIPLKQGKRAELCETFDVSFNELRSVPEALREITGLKLLRLDHNRLRTIPSGIVTLPNLQWLSLNNNLLDSLPEEEEGQEYSFDRLTILIAHNNLKKLPHWWQSPLNTGQWENTPDDFLRFSAAGNLLIPDSLDPGTIELLDEQDPHWELHQRNSGATAADLDSAARSDRAAADSIRAAREDAEFLREFQSGNN